MELNPNHPMTSAMRDHWHKIVAILVNRMRDKKTTITAEEIGRMKGLAIITKESAVGIELLIVTMEEGERLARQEGGLPV